MQGHELPPFEQDPRFPSGSWTGFFLQYWIPGRHTTDLDLMCRNGDLVGRGKDRVGPFTIDGEYDLETGQCEWIKKYTGKHSVAYRGVNDGRGIWGVWEIRLLGGLYVDRGGFHIWPEGSDVSEESDRTEQAVLEKMREEFGSRSYRAFRGVLILGLAVAIALLLKWQWMS
jgi:hypothetical protein